MSQQLLVGLFVLFEHRRRAGGKARGNVCFFPFVHLQKETPHHTRPVHHAQLLHAFQFPAQMLAASGMHVRILVQFRVMVMAQDATESFQDAVSPNSFVILMRIRRQQRGRCVGVDAHICVERGVRGRLRCAGPSLGFSTMKD